MHTHIHTHMHTYVCVCMCVDIYIYILTRLSCSFYPTVLIIWPQLSLCASLMTQMLQECEPWLGSASAAHPEPS